MLCFTGLYGFGSSTGGLNKWQVSIASYPQFAPQEDSTILYLPPEQTYTQDLFGPVLPVLHFPSSFVPLSGRGACLSFVCPSGSGCRLWSLNFIVDQDHKTLHLPPVYNSLILKMGFKISYSRQVYLSMFGSCDFPCLSAQALLDIWIPAVLVAFTRLASIFFSFLVLFDC